MYDFNDEFDDNDIEDDDDDDTEDDDVYDEFEDMDLDNEFMFDEFEDMDLNNELMFDDYDYYVDWQNEILCRKMLMAYVELLIARIMDLYAAFVRTRVSLYLMLAKYRERARLFLRRNAPFPRPGKLDRWIDWRISTHVIRCKCNLLRLLARVDKVRTFAHFSLSTYEPPRLKSARRIFPRVSVNEFNSCVPLANPATFCRNSSFVGCLSCRKAQRECPNKNYSTRNFACSLTCVSDPRLYLPLSRNKSISRDTWTSRATTGERSND